jgi:cell division protein ZapA
MVRPPVEVTVGGQIYRLIASAGEHTLRRCAQVVDQRLSEMTGHDRSPPPQALLLVALSLAHDLEEERARHAREAEGMEHNLRRLLGAVDDALGGVDENGECLPPGRR